MGAVKSKIPQPEGKPVCLYRDNFLLTTDKTYLSPQVVNQAFSSDLMWWNDSLEPKEMQKMLKNCMTFGIYAVPETLEQMEKNGPPKRAPGPDMKMVGLARLVTDYVTFAYLTDVFVLENYQRQGLGRWMMDAVKTTVDAWPNLRGLLLMTHSKSAAKMYEEALGAVEFDRGPSKDLVVLEMPGQKKTTCPSGH